MPWIAPTASDILAALPEEERNLYAAIADDDDDAELLEEIIRTAAAKIRGRVRACAKNVLDPDETRIPDTLKGELLAIVRFELIARIGAEEMSDTDPRRTLYNEATRTLTAVARCEVGIEPGASVASNGISIVSRRPRHDRRENLNGLL